MVKKTLSKGLEKLAPSGLKPDPDLTLPPKVCCCNSINFLDSKSHNQLATGGFQGEMFLKIISGEPRQRAWEEVREAREVALSLF